MGSDTHVVVVSAVATSAHCQFLSLEVRSSSPVALVTSRVYAGADPNRQPAGTPLEDKPETGPLTSLLGFDLQDVGRRPVSHRREAEHAEAVCDVGSQARDGGQAAVVRVVFLPGAERRSEVRAVVHPVAPDLPVGFLRRLPLDQHRAGAQHPRLDVKRWRGRRLLACTCLHRVAGWPPANVVDGHDSELVLRVGAEPADAVAGGGHPLHLLEAVVGGLGSVLDHVVGHGFRVARVPGEGDAGCRGLCHDEGGGRLGQG